MGTKRFFRYLLPNLVTFASLTFGMCSIVASIQGRWTDAAWFVIFSVLTDKLDGFVARLVKGTSEFGVQLDSFADFLNFGIAPATLWFAYLSRPDSPLADGAPYVVMIASTALWVLAVTFRLARYNIVGDDPKCKRIFFGVPTTLMGGLLCALFLVCLKYGADPSGQTMVQWDEPRIRGLAIGDTVWKLWPALVTAGALLMASAVKIPKLGLSKSKALTVFIFANVAAGYAFGATRHFPEFLLFDATRWVVSSLVWGVFNRDLRDLRPPPIFPRVDLPAAKQPQRPEEDAVPDDAENDEDAASASAEDEDHEGSPIKTH
jgi:CDP-diacylglycerol--serine O-phosphatidyltransferase